MEIWKSSQTRNYYKEKGEEKNQEILTKTVTISK
jgi:hypothetical protein